MVCLFVCLISHELNKMTSYYLVVNISTRVSGDMSWSQSLEVTFCHTSPPWRWGGSSTQAGMPTYVSILRIPQMIWVWRATVEWYWQGKTEELGEKPVQEPLCPPQIPHGLTRARTLASAVRGRRLTTWAMAGSFCYVPVDLSFLRSICILIVLVRVHAATSLCLSARTNALTH
jgi:hypothetical protein